MVSETAGPTCGEWTPVGAEAAGAVEAATAAGAPATQSEAEAVSVEGQRYGRAGSSLVAWRLGVDPGGLAAAIHGQIQRRRD